MISLKLKQEIVHPENIIEVPQMELFNLFDAIETESGRNAKIEILSHANEQQTRLIELAFNPYRQFHITKWNHFGIHKDDYGKKFKHDQEAYIEFLELCEYAQKINRCSELEQRTDYFFSKCNEQQTKWFARILKKDLAFGLQVKSINKVFPNLIPSFEVMLAEKAEKDFSNVDFSRPLSIERKYDGFRVLVFYREDGTVDVIGRSGKEILNNEFVRKVSEPKDKLKGWVLDGEGYCHSQSFEQFSGTMRREDAKLPLDFGFYIFDCMDIEHWNNQQSLILESRLGFRRKVCSYSDFFVEVNGSIFSHNEDSSWIEAIKIQGISFIKEHYEQFLEEGYEGAMLKYLDAPYCWGRSDAMLKIKPEDFIDGKIIGYYEGEGAIKGKLGGFIVLLDDGKDTEVRVGGGYKLWEREKFWLQAGGLINRWIEIKFTEKTAAGSLRHPNFRRLRDDK